MRRSQCISCGNDSAVDEMNTCSSCNEELSKLESEIRHFPPVEAIKHDQNKPDMSFLTYELCEEIAKVRTFGAVKYSRDNWKKGFKITRSLAAALRHILKFLGGEDNDPESDLCHLSHAVCCLEHAIWDFKKHPANDDRKV